MKTAKKTKTSSKKKVAKDAQDSWHSNVAASFILIGVVGLIASFSLALERLASLIDPNRVALCDINPILSCGSVMSSTQASLLGIPHSFLGIAAFSALITVGIVLLAGAKLAQWFWGLLLLGSFIGFLSVQYLVYQSLFVLNTLCPWCMVVWLIVVPLFFIVTAYVTKYKLITFKSNFLNQSMSFIGRHAFTITVLWFIAVIYFIIVEFWSYWSLLLL